MDMEAEVNLWFAVWEGLTRKRKNMSKLKTRKEPFSDSHVYQTISRNDNFVASKNIGKILSLGVEAGRRAG